MRSMLQSRRNRRTRKASEGIVTGSSRTIPPELARLRRTSLYLDLPSSICREQLNQSIEKQIVEDGLEDEDLVETWSYFYEEAWFAIACPYDEGFGADDE